jgi:hypothetical protein
MEIDPGTHMRCTRLCPPETGVTNVLGSVQLRAVELSVNYCGKKERMAVFRGNNKL